jgi:predicted PurR-regulated permease PerM
VSLPSKGRRPPAPPVWLFVLLAGFAYLLFTVHEVLIPFLLSFALAYVLNPVINYFEVRGFRRDLVVGMVYLVLAIAVTIGASSILPAMTRELAMLQGKAPGYFAKVQQMAADTQHRLAQELPFGQAVVESWSLKLYDPVMKQLPKVPQYVLGLFPLFSLLFLVPFITFFLLMDSKRILQNAIQVCPSRYVEQALHLLSEIDTSLGNYIRGLLIISSVIGVSSYIGLVLLEVDYALGVATLAGLSSFIPYLGAIIGAVVGALVAFFQYHNFTMPIYVVVLFLGIRIADEAFVQPAVSKHSIHLHPLVFLMSLMIGGKLFGFIGLLFAVPAACIIKSLFIVAWHWYATETMIDASDLEGVHVPYI